MKQFAEKAAKVTSTIALVTGLVLAIGAALQAFTDTMNKHYKPENETDSN
jgi:hypothetical protein